jgi:hypothetical protein
VAQRRREGRLEGAEEVRAGRSGQDGCADGLVERTADVVKDWLVCAGPRPASECAQMDAARALTAADVTSADDVCSVLDLTRYPEAAAATLKSEIEAARLQEEEAEKKAEKSHVANSCSARTAALL